MGKKDLGWLGGGPPFLRRKRSVYADLRKKRTWVVTTHGRWVVRGFLIELWWVVLFRKIPRKSRKIPKNAEKSCGKTTTLSQRASLAASS